ncbi:hypothetical protein BRUCa_0093 [Brucella melitensis]|nr:hypothetical protein BM28_A0093 [Brucella melitensis M28]AIB20196.1 Hypothetical protein BSPT1_I0086 [Brucella suis bv. 2]AIB30321.1 Hypothetical protein BSSP2_I0085 [Brucella suis bv. 2]
MKGTTNLHSLRLRYPYLSIPAGMPPDNANSFKIGRAEQFFEHWPGKSDQGLFWTYM